VLRRDGKSADQILTDHIVPCGFGEAILRKVVSEERLRLGANRCARSRSAGAVFMRSSSVGEALSRRWVATRVPRRSIFNFGTLAKVAGPELS